jgi:hypothetical protein
MEPHTQALMGLAVGLMLGISMLVGFTSEFKDAFPLPMRWAFRGMALVMAIAAWGIFAEQFH